MKRLLSACALAPLLAALLGAGAAMADTVEATQTATATAPPEEFPIPPPDAPVAAPAPQGRGLSFIVAPIPVSNPAIGSGLALGVVALYRAGGAERPWASGVGGLYTDTGSWGGAVFQKAYLGHDRFRVTAALGVGSANVEFFGIGPNAGSRGISVPINESARGAFFEGLMRVAPNFFAGVEYRYIDMETTLLVVPPLFPDLDLPPLQLDATVSALGLAAEYDTRDNEYGPTRGVYVTGTWLYASESLGSDFDYSRVETAANAYIAMGGGVLASRLSFCWVGDEAPFFDLCSYGSAADLRGYVSGQYIDHSLWAMQVEYRRHLFWRIGGVAFAGVGQVGSSVSDFAHEDMLPAGGLGVRVTVSRQYGVNFGIDYAWGIDSQALYFRVGEAF